MKKILAIVLFLLLLISCDVLSDIYYFNLAKNHELYYGDFGEIETFEDISDFIKSKVHYQSDGKDIYSNPEEVLNRGYGDCDDYAILFMNIAYVELGLKFDLSLVYSTENNQREIDKGGWIDHAVVMLHGKLYSAYEGTIITEYYSSYHYTFYEVFNI